MSNDICFVGPAYSVNGQEVYAVQQPSFELLFNSESDKNTVIASEWFLDGVLIASWDNFQLDLQIANGAYAIGARILTAAGWSGVKYFSFLNVNNADSFVLSGPSLVNEGQTVNYQVSAMYNGEMVRDATNEYIFTSSEGAFNGNVYTAANNDIVNDSRQVTITALKNGRPPLTKQITVINTTPIALTSISISGPLNVNEGSTENTYTLFAHYNDGSKIDKTVESVFTLLASNRGSFVNNKLRIFANTVNGDSISSKVTGFYAGLSMDYPMFIIDTSPVVLISLTLNGPTVVDEGSTENTFRLYANFSDGTSLDKTNESVFSFSIPDRAGFVGNKLTVFANDVVDDSLLGNVFADYGGMNITYEVEIVDRTEQIIIDQFDFMTVRFGWLDGAGKDLDVLVAYEGTGTSVDGLYVGFGQSATVPRVISPQSDAYLWWATDNMGYSGYEGVLIGIKKYIEAFPETNNLIDIFLYAAWYGQPITGNYTIELVTYLGGTMSISGSNFINIGGEQVSSDVFNVNTLNRPTGGIENYDNVGKISYNKTTQQSIVQIFQIYY